MQLLNDDIRTVGMFAGFLASLEDDRVLLRLVAAFHGLVAAGTALATDAAITTQATAPVLAMAPRPVWAVVFACLAVLVAVQARAPYGGRLAVWFAVFLVGAWWLIGFAVGHAWAAFTLGLFLYAFFGVTAFRLGLRKR